MLIDHYQFTPPDMEILYYFEEDPNATLLKAPYSWAREWFEMRYDTTLITEQYDYQQADITQYYQPQNPNDWLAQLPTDTRHQALEKFVQFCMNSSIGASVSFSS